MGAAAAFFLCDRGERDVLVLERDQLGSGTTKGGLGGIRHQFVDELDIRMSQLATAFLAQFRGSHGLASRLRGARLPLYCKHGSGVAELCPADALYERMRAGVRMVDRVESPSFAWDPRVRRVRRALRREDGYGDPSGSRGFAASPSSRRFLLEGVLSRRSSAKGRVTESEPPPARSARTGSSSRPAADLALARDRRRWRCLICRTASSIMQSGPVPRLAKIPHIDGSRFLSGPREPRSGSRLPNITTDGKEKGPPSHPRHFRANSRRYEVPASLEPWVRARAAWRHPAFADVRIVDSWSCY